MTRALMLSALWICAQTASAGVKPLPESSTIARAKALAAELGLPTREVVAGPAHAQVTRLAMPLRPEHWERMIDTFGLHKNPETGKFEGSLIFRQIFDDMSVVAPPGMKISGRVLDPASALYLFDLEVNRAKPAVIVHLSPAQADHVGRWLSARMKDKFFQVGGGCSDIMMNIEVEPAADGTHTVRLVSDAEAASQDLSRVTGGQPGVAGSGVRMGKTIAAHTGVRASRKGSYMMMKWKWSGNDLVQVLLVPEVDKVIKTTVSKPFLLPNGLTAMRQITEEHTVPQLVAEMSVEDLLGPQHPHGIDAASRPVNETVRQLDLALIEARRQLADLTSNRGEIAALEKRIADLQHRTSKGFYASSQEEVPALEKELAELEAQRAALAQEEYSPMAVPTQAVTALRGKIEALEAQRAAAVQDQ